MGAPLVHTLRVRYGESDLQGIAFNAHYLNYFDIGMTELWRAAHGSYQAMLERGVDMVLAEARLRFRKPARFDDELDLSVAVTHMGTTSIVTRHVARAPGTCWPREICATCWSTCRRWPRRRSPTGLARDSRRGTCPRTEADSRRYMETTRTEAQAMTVDHETIFTMEATPVKFGRGASAEAGWELRRLGVRRAMLVTDPGVAALGHPERIKELIEAEGIEVVLYPRARVEPTIGSFEDAVEFAREHEVDGFVSVGGGSSIDTAKVADLVTTHVAPVMDYVNPPFGAGKKPPSPLKPHLAIPTTSGTGSEATTVAVLDIPDLKVKTGISHRYLRPTQAIVDPDLSRSLPPEVTSSTGLDVVCHAAESFLSKPFDTRARPDSPEDRPPYQGCEPGRRRVVGEGARVRGPVPEARGRGRR